MATGLPVERSPSRASLRHVLELGENLLCIAQEASADGASASEILPAQCDLIAQTASRLFNARTGLWFSDSTLAGLIGTPKLLLQAETDNQLLRHPTPLIQTCVHTLRPAAAESAASVDTWDIKKSRMGREIRAITAPLLVKNRIDQTSSLLGVIQLERNGGPSFSRAEIELFNGMAVQSALVIQSSLGTAGERWRREQLGLVSRVSLEIAALRDLDEIARRVTELVLTTFDYYYVAIFTLETDQDVLSFRANAGPGLESGNDGKIFAPVSLGEGIIGTVAQTGKELLAADVQQEPRYRHFELLPETQSEIALPLISQDRLVGVLDVQSNQLNDFDEVDLLVLRALAGNIAIAIEGAQLYQNLRHRAVQLQTVYEVSRAIASILDQDQLLDEVVTLIQERFKYPYVHLFSVHGGRRKIFYEAGSGLRSRLIQKEAYTYDLDDPQGLIPWAARNAETLLVNDVRKEPRYRPSGIPSEETFSELTVPLVFGGKVLGILDVQSDQINAFGEEDRFLFEALGDHIAIALRNASLYRTEVWRRKVADSLQEVAGILSADVDLDQVLEAVLGELEHTLPLDAAAIWLLDESAQVDGIAPPVLHLAAVLVEDADDLDLEIGLKPDEVLEYNLNHPDQEVLLRASAWLLEVLDTDSPIVRLPESLFEPLGVVLGFSADYSAIGAPLKIGDHTLGVLSLVHGSPGRYGGEAQAMTAAFGNYAAVAIENARLYEDAHEQAWISTVLLQVANATQSVDNLTELLDTVIRITPMLTGVKACLLYILDDDGTFVPAAATGLSSEQQSEFERWRFAPGDASALDRLVLECRPVILHRGEQDQRLASILTAGTDDDDGTEFGFPVLIPLHARGDVLGAFLVDYSATLPTLSLGKSFEAFFDERLAILQGIAHQTAVAVDNIRLLKAQKEEAYVSVALLQVAQAVVSSNDLNEALGSIVRITPILVGVQRAAIFLWDESQNVFRLSQAYGLPRSVESQAYRLGEFPLLDAVLVENALLALPLSREDDEDEALASWVRLGTPERDEVDRYLLDEEFLLIAFPLSVKGKVLGVFLAEEPNPIPGEVITSGNANRRLRPKRMEIVTGISQQAALAIQNDTLQKEIVERERLEREMQLAREIQVAFLPQQIPEIPGWDLQVHWSPAREVGGDFYDFFELPGDRLGLVIADVADKGVPAALFMTLVRTLVRATVQVLDSPAEVVERVNDLLVPDALGGMFVTLVYAVLDLKSGELLIANAGHNPPLTFHSPFRFTRAEPGGMALGVEPGIKVHASLSQLELGDLLVLYTDGVTETFSPDGEMFGEGSLLETIEKAAIDADAERQVEVLTARDLLNAIDNRVLEFCGGTAPFDDLTLVVVKRLT